MKTWQALAAGASIPMIMLGVARADTLISPVQESSVTIIAPDAAAPAVVVPAVVAPRVVVVSPVHVTTIKREREGDWYVLRGTAELDRPRNALRVKDNEGNVTELIFGDDVRISRQGESISYFDVNNGDYVIVRYKDLDSPA